MALGGEAASSLPSEGALIRAMDFQLVNVCLALGHRINTLHNSQHLPHT